ncbi:MAG: PIN domain-containing protein [Alphaproteobacteria bacterium]|nr:PIN domain-containing protein [Alphaproteobacteria bacterium]
MSRYAVVYDACVLYSAPLRDLLLELALTDLFRAKWTDAIHEEWIGAVLRQRPDLDRARLERTRVLMNSHVRDALVEGYEPLIGAIDGLPDPNDRHVVAAAAHSRADAVVTFNLKDFPAGVLDRHGLEAIHPDRFVRAQMDLGEAALGKVLGCVRRCRERLARPPFSVAEYLDCLERQALPTTVAELRMFASIL